MATSVTIQAITATLAQTQCQQCGYPSCEAYGIALHEKKAPINLCQPGGTRVIQALADLLGQPVIAPAKPALSPQIIEITTACIGCTLCINACPTGAITGAPRQQHQVMAPDCTGCRLCVPPCPANCIDLIPGGIADSKERAAYIKRLVSVKKDRENAKKARKSTVASVRKQVKQGENEPNLHQKERILAARQAAARKWKEKPAAVPKVLQQKQAKQVQGPSNNGINAHIAGNKRG